MKLIYEEIEVEMGENCIKAISDNGVVMLIPKDPANSDYQRYLRWLNGEEENEGNLE